MNDTDLIRRGAFGLAAIALPILIAITLALPAVIAGLFIVIAVLAVVAYERLRHHPTTPPPAAIPQSPPTTATTAIRTMMPSSTADYSFRLSGVVTWHPLRGSRATPHMDPAAIASDAVLARACEVARSCSPADLDMAGCRLAAALGSPQEDEGGQVRAWVTDVTVEIDSKDAERLRTLAGLRKDVVLWEHQRGHERNVRQYLGGEVLATTGNAVVWGLARHLDDVERAVSLVQPLHRLSRVARGDLDDLPAEHVFVGWTDEPTAAPPNPDGPGMDKPGTGPAVRPSAVGLVEELFPHDTDERRYFVHTLAELLHGAGRTEHEQDLRTTFGVPRADVPSEDETLQ